MEATHFSRVILISIDDLKKIKFSKLEQVCDRVYVFVDKEETAIPFFLVQQLQRLGETVQWVAIDGNSQEAMYTHIAFYLGLLHEQLDEEIEIAFISENTILDSLVAFINDRGRNCVRVTKNKQKTSENGELGGITWSATKEETTTSSTTTTKTEEPKAETKDVPPAVVQRPAPTATTVTTTVPTATAAVQTTPTPTPVAVTTNGTNGTTASDISQQLSERIARETVKRLVLSGNRPAALESLKSYILLQYNNAEIDKHIELIIQKMESSNEIKINNEEVVYHF